MAGQRALLERQIEAVGRREPHIVCLQEIRPTTVARWREALAADGLSHALDSGRFTGGRRLFNLVASREPLSELAPIGAQQPERVLSALIDPGLSDHSAIEASFEPEPIGAGGFRAARKR